MTELQTKIIKFAEALGWTNIQTLDASKPFGSPPNASLNQAEYLPNWPEDLNACAQIEGPVLRTDAERYIHLLKCERGEHWGFANAMERFNCLYALLVGDGKEAM